MTADLLGLAWADEEHAREWSRALGEPDWLADERIDAIRRYADLPVETNRLFTGYVDMRAAKLGAIDPYVALDAGVVEQPLPEGVAALVSVAADGTVGRAISPDAATAGVVIDSFAGVLRTRPDVLRAAIEGGQTLPTNDKLGQLARAMASVGVIVHVPAGVSLEQPIVIRWGGAAPGRGLVTRTVLDLAADAHARVLEEHVRGADGGDGHSLWQGTMEVRLFDNATLEVAAEQDFGAGTVGIVNRHATLGRDAQLQWALASVGGALVKSRVDNQLEGRGSSVRQVEIGFGGGSQLFDLTSYTRHIGPDTSGDILSKGVFQDRARGYFKGLIEIHRPALGTDSYLGEFAMLLSKKARSVAIPSLEIDQPDVRRASHSSSVGPIDEAQIFYLESRGVPRDVARKLIVLAFLEPVVSRIPVPEAQDRLRELLDRKWSTAAAVPVAA